MCDCCSCARALCYKLLQGGFWMVMTAMCDFMSPTHAHDKCNCCLTLHQRLPLLRATQIWLKHEWRRPPHQIPHTTVRVRGRERRAEDVGWYGRQGGQKSLHGCTLRTVQHRALERAPFERKRTQVLRRAFGVGRCVSHGWHHEDVRGQGVISA